MIAEVDEDNNGYCEYDEFLLLMSKKINENKIGEEMREAFNNFDKDKKDHFTKADLKKVLDEYHEALTPEELELMF